MLCYEALEARKEAIKESESVRYATPGHAMLCYATLRYAMPGRARRAVAQCQPVRRPADVRRRRRGARAPLRSPPLCLRVRQVFCVCVCV